METGAKAAAGSLEDRSAYHALRDGRLTYQRCRACGRAWLPERSECPDCLGNVVDRLNASGAARLISWIVYHRAPAPAFAERVPYTVAIVELAEGPRLISNIIEIEDPEALVIDQALRLVVREQFGATVPLFTPTRGAGGTSPP